MQGLRLIVTVIIFSSFFVYSLFLKKNTGSYFSSNKDYVVEKVPPIFFNYYERDDLGESAINFFHFWATWCGPCEKELPDFIDFVNSFQGQVRGVLIASKDNKAKALAKLSKFDVGKNFAVIHDLDGELLKNFGSLRVPETFIFSSEGNLVKKFVGPQDWTNKFYFENTKFLINKFKTL